MGKQVLNLASYNFPGLAGDEVIKWTMIPSHAASPIIRIRLQSAATLSVSASAPAKPSNPATPAPHDARSFDIVGEERLLQDFVDEARAQERGPITCAPHCEAPPMDAVPPVRLTSHAVHISNAVAVESCKVLQVGGAGHH
ncbi:hypothetical protein EDB85DRAFT_1894799 [Lactarius pseudohatsudake]|nr:hypothetical protein EDB85DRAFT_1894799 [Lactarius pseudohatsudake]